MNIARLSIEKRIVTLVATAVLLAGGVYAYQNIGRLEDPEFTIKEALVVTRYPGASPEEVESEVSEVIERAAQKMGQVERVTSRSERGRSTVTVTMKDRYDSASLPQVWDELRRKVTDAQGELPPGAGPSLVMDDFGDVYGITYALYGDGHSYADLQDAAEFLQRELLLVHDVAKVSLFGLVPEVVYVEISQERLAALGLPRHRIFDVLSARNLVRDAGHVRAGTMHLVLEPTGTTESVEDLGETLLTDHGGTLIYLRDVARVYRGYLEPPQQLLRFNGRPAVGIGISTVSGGNVVTMGEALKERLKALEGDLPLGMELGVINMQSDDVQEAIGGFVANVVAAVVIVVIVLLIAMGVRSGLIMGAMLFLTICATLVGMYGAGTTLERVSLGALIIALGMLVDNGIVIIDGMLVRMQRGMDRIEAAAEVVRHTAWPLLGATIIAVLAFAPIGFSQDSTGEYCRSLFVVLLISLMASWFIALTVTPLFGYLFLKQGSAPAKGDERPADGRVLRWYRGFLESCLARRGRVLAAMLFLMLVAGAGLQLVDRSFFPPSTREQVKVDLWLPSGTHIDETVAAVEEAESLLKAMEGVTDLIAFIGGGGPRFLLTYSAEKPDTGYAQLIVGVNDYERIDSLIREIVSVFEEELPMVEPSFSRFALGPGGAGKVRARFIGPEPEVLRRLAEDTLAIYRADADAYNIRSDWRDRTKKVVPLVSELQARRAGLTRAEVADALRTAHDGLRIGLYREGDRLLPVIARSPEAERRRGTEAMADFEAYSPITGRSVPLRQVVSGFEAVWEDPIILRRNRARAVEVLCDPKDGTASALFARVRPQIEALPLPEGYRLEWGGEVEDSGDAMAGIQAQMPISFLLMLLILVTLFNSLRHPLIIWLTVPLAIIGVVIGLLVTGHSLGFLAILGTLSLSGMVIKNTIVLIDEIEREKANGKEAYAAIVDAAISRMRPVSMAALTTVLGMVPLFLDPFFAAMAVAIAFGLTFATVLTLVVVPVLYAALFRVRTAAA